MNELLFNYKEWNKVSTWKNKFSSAAQDVIMYKFKSTNGRNLNSYNEKFKNFLDVEGLERDKWPKYRNGQQIHKQYTVPMIESKLFYKEGEMYHKTAKGHLYEKYLDLDLNEDETWLINYLLLMDSTMSNVENYLINRSIEINDILVTNTSAEFVEKSCKNLFAYRNSLHHNQKELARYDYLYLNSFYLEPQMLTLYYNSTDDEKRELQEYIFENWKLKNKADCISKKFVSTNYSCPEILDDLKIFMFSLEINKIKYTDFDTTAKKIVDIYSADYDINSEIILNFLFDNRNIIEPIFINVFNIEEIEDITNEENEDHINTTLFENSEEDQPEPKIDDTTISGKQQLNQIFSIRKKIAREKSNYSCALSEYNGCRYFTSRTTNKNYVEVHHLVPRAFRNNFEYSVDVLANYVTLCPHCHRLIHNATDRERQSAILYLYRQRKERLKNCGIETKYNDLLSFYNVEDTPMIED